jgi:predicted Zn-dependent peptidase
MAHDLAAVARSQLPIERRVLDSGTVVIRQASPANAIIATKVFAPIGSSAEPADVAGLANMSVRLLSAGTGHRSEREISLALEANGAHFSADASKDASAVSLLSTRDWFSEDFEVLLDLLRDPVFPEKQLARDRGVVRMMIREDDDSPFNFTYRLFRRWLFDKHSYGWSSLGLEETVERITRDEVVRFSLWQRRPETLVVLVVGGDEESTLLDSVCEKIQQMPAIRIDCEPSVPPVPTEPARAGVYEEYRDGEAEWIISGTFGPPFTGADFIPFRVLDSVLGGSMDSRLFSELRERRGLAYQVGSQYSAHLLCGVYALYAVSTPTNRDEVLRVLRLECERLREEPVGDEELQRAKQYLIGRHIMGMESNTGRAATLGTYELSGLGAEAVFEYPERISSVDAAAVQRVAQRYLRDLVTMITTPRKPAATRVSSASAQDMESAVTYSQKGLEPAGATP